MPSNKNKGSVMALSWLVSLDINVLPPVAASSAAPAAATDTSFIVHAIIIDAKDKNKTNKKLR